MAIATILLIDSDPFSYQMVQNCFPNTDVSVFWVREMEQAIGLGLQDVVVILAHVRGEDDYELVADIKHSFPDSVLFVLTAEDAYDFFLARNAGASGAFFTPLSAGVLQSRLEEFVYTQPKALLDGVYVPSSSEQIAKIISFSHVSPEAEDIEMLVQELLPLVVEQVLRLHLTNNTKIRSVLLDDIRRMVVEEIQKHNSPS